VDIADRTYAYFEAIHRNVFAGDPASNRALTVEVVQPGEVDGLPTLVLITPWTLNGMVFGDLTNFPTSMTVGAKEYSVLAHSLVELGPYRSVNLVSDVSNLESQEAARRVARAYVQPFRRAVAKALQEARVEDRNRRALLRGLTRSDKHDPTKP
jgi:hypothetical protein